MLRDAELFDMGRGGWGRKESWGENGVNGVREGRKRRGEERKE